MTVIQPKTVAGSTHVWPEHTTAALMSLNFEIAQSNYESIIQPIWC